MNENLAIFLNKFLADRELQERFEKTSGEDECYEIALTVQDGYSKDEFVKAMIDLRDAVQEDISMDDLDKVAGGISNSSHDKIVATVTASVGATASASAVSAAILYGAATMGAGAI